MKLYWKEIRDIESDYHFTEANDWVAHAVLAFDESDEKPSLPKGGGHHSEDRSIIFDVEVRRVDEIVMLTGKIDTKLHLCCSRCTTLFWFPVRVRISSLFCQDPEMAGIAYLKKEKSQSGHHTVLKPSGQRGGFSRPVASNFSKEFSQNSKGRLETSEDLDISYVSDDCIDLSDVLSEHIQLQVPFQPLCNESCKGMCANCGADLNKGRCACAKIKDNNPFAALKGMRFE